MPAFRIVYTRGDNCSPEAITASFNDLDQALSVFAARGLGIIYIAEQGATERRPIAKLVERPRRGHGDAPHRANSFPLRRFTGRAMA